MHPLIAYEWMFGVTECLHILGFAVAVGSIALVDLRLLGLGLRETTAASVHEQMRRWTLGGLLLAVASGLVILSTDASRYLAHPVMQFKLAALGLATLLNYTWHTRVVRASQPPAAHCLLAALPSLLLWASIVFAGIFYAFF